MINEMQLRQLKKVLLAFASITLLTPVVHAATITTAMGDLILGFRANANPGQTLDLEVDLGNMSNFYGAVAGSTIPLPGLSVADLSATFGTTWGTRTDLFWGAVATTGRAVGTPDGHAPVGTLWATAPANAPAWIRETVFAQKDASPAIEEMIVIDALGSLDGATSTTNSDYAAVINATQAGSWSYEDLKTAGTSFGYFNPTIDSPANIPVGSQVVAQLYELQPSSTAEQPGTLLGNLVLTQNGLSFHAAGGSAGPIIGISGNLAFGSVPTGTTATATLTITNAGLATLAVTNITYPGGFSGAFSGAIAAGRATNVTVTFAPTAVTSYGGTIIVTSDATSGISTILVAGSGQQLTTTISGQADPSNAGTVSGAGTYPVGSLQQISAIANSCWTFMRWSDGLTNGTRTITVPTTNLTYTAIFSQQSETITVQANPSNGGTVSGGGAVPCGSNVTVTATSGACAQFANWTEGGILVSTSPNYTFAVTSNQVLVANFTLASYTVTTRASPAAGGMTFGGGSVICGSNVTVNATNNTPYQFIGWTENGTMISSTASYNFPVTMNRDLVAQFDQPPLITVTPFVTNALLVVSNSAVVVVGETNVFSVSATDPDGNALTYQWVYGDGVTNAWSPLALATHVYATSDCGPYDASVTVSDGQLTVRSNLTVIAACDLAISKFQVGVNFAKQNADSISLTAKLDLFGITNVVELTGAPLVVDVGDVQVPFTLNNKGHGISANGSCVITYTKPTKTKPGVWTLIAALSKGTWYDQWVGYGLTNATIKSPGVSVTLPVVVLIGNEAFAAEPQLHYTATKNKTGTAK